MIKKTTLSFLLVLTMGLITKAQTTRYFEFSTSCGHGNWQDTSFIASTSDLVLIDSVLANIGRPLSQRKFISGNIGYGNGGHNHNSSHWFLWHFIPNQWELVDFAIEVCDGCPFTDIDSDTSYWVGNLGEFCPWSGKPIREVSSPLGISHPIFEKEISLYPNPASNTVSITWHSLKDLNVSIHNALGEEVKSVLLKKHNPIINITNLRSGVYFLRISEDNKVGVKRLIINKE